jgi:hypothetical protein
MERLGLAQQWDIDKEFIKKKVVRHGIWAIRPRAAASAPPLRTISPFGYFSS